MSGSLSTISRAQKTSEWRLDKDSKGVMVYTREVEGYPIREFRAVTRINASRETVLRKIRDYENQEEWTAGCDFATVLDDHPDGGKVVYLQINTPFPVSDRDMVMWMHEPEEKNGAVFIYGETVENFREEDPDFVRFSLSKGFWKVEPSGDGTVEVTNQYLSDPGGSIPKWLVNSMLTGTPHKTMVNLKRALEK